MISFKKIKSLDKYTKLAIIIILIGTLIRFSLASINAVSGDACWTLSIARFIGENYEIPLFENLGRDSIFSRGPLFHIIAAIFFNVFGIFSSNAANFGLKMVSPLFGSLTLVLLYYFTREFYDKRTAFIAVSILTFLPIHMHYSVRSYVEPTLIFFALLAVFFMLKKKLILSSIAAGITVLLKLEGLFMIPLLLVILSYINRKNIKVLLKKSLIFLGVSFLFYAPLLIRNFIYLGNPVWPFLVNIIGGHPISGNSYVATSFMNLFNVSNLMVPYLELFGVPNGNYNNIFFINIPFLGVLTTIWILATLFYFSFFIYGLIKINKKNPASIFLILWICTFIIFLSLSIIFTKWAFGRYLMTALPAIVIIWAIGLNEVLKIKRLKSVFIVVVMLIITGFVFTEFTKSTIATKSWGFYDEDFKWIVSNTGKDSTIFFIGQCLAYNTKRFTIYPINPITKQYTLPEKLEELGESYAWINQEFRLEGQSILPWEVVNAIEKDYELIYDNKKTKTRLYKIKD